MSLVLTVFSFFANLIREIRKICITIKKQVSAKFPGHEDIAMGAFLFLRFFSTAISVPESYGLLRSVLAF